MFANVTVKSSAIVRSIERPIFYDEAVMGVLNSSSGSSDTLTESTRDLIRMAADAALQRGPYSVVDKTVLPPSQDPHDYYHPAPYFWPRKYFGRWLPAQRRDGQRVPGTRLYEPLSEQYDRTRLQRMFDDTTVLALAWRTLGEDTYAQHAIRIVETWFVCPETRMHPHLKYAQVRMGGRQKYGSKSGIIEFKDIYFFLDAVRLLSVHPSWSAELDAGFRAWIWDYFDWLQNSPQGVAESQSRNNHGTCYDLQLASIAVFLGELDVVNSLFEGLGKRLCEQFTDDGSQPLEAGRTQTQHYFAFNLQSWLNLATLTGAVGLDLWELSLSVKRPLVRALEYFLSYINRPWELQQIDAFGQERFWPFALEYNFRQADPLQHIPLPQTLNAVVFPHYGIRPFWLMNRVSWKYLMDPNLTNPFRTDTFK
jgi:hypothetical protein